MFNLKGENCKKNEWMRESLVKGCACGLSREKDWPIGMGYGCDGNRVNLK